MHGLTLSHSSCAAQFAIAVSSLLVPGIPKARSSRATEKVKAKKSTEEWHRGTETTTSSKRLGSGTVLKSSEDTCVNLRGDCLSASNNHRVHVRRC